MDRLALAATLVALATPAVTGAAVPLPDVPGIQAAYEAAYIATRGKPPGEHADDLRIENAHCQPLKPGPGAACQIDFVRQRDPDGRLYFDIVTLQQEPQGTAWVLRSGLCMTKPADRHAALKTGASAAAR